MEEFIKSISGNLGIPEGNARSATAGLLGLIREKGGEDDFSSIVQSIPGTSQLLQESGSADMAGEQAAGGLGGLLSKASTVLGGDAGGSAALMGTLSKSGLDLGQAGTFVSQFLNFLKEKAGSDLTSRVLGQFPEMEKLVK